MPFQMTSSGNLTRLPVVYSPETTHHINRREAWLLGLAFVFLLASGLALLLAPLVRAGGGGPPALRWAPLICLPVWIGVAWGARHELKRACPHRDPLLLPVAMLLAGWGLILIWRLSPGFGLRQTGWLVVAGALLVLIIRAPADLRWLRRYRYLWLAAGLLLLSLTLVFGSNPSGGEPKLWLGCCGLYMQPSEPLRLLLIAFLASYLADRAEAARTASPRRLIALLSPLLLVWGLSVALLLVQRDLGTGTLFLVMLAVLLYLATGRPALLLIAGAAALVGAGMGYAASATVRLRFNAWLNPWADPSGGAYQLVQSLMAIAAGGLLGRGPGLGSPGFVPVAHTDFALAAIGEEWGLVGTLAIVCLFALLATRGLRTAAGSRNLFDLLLAAGLAAAFGLQSLLIMGGVSRMLPLTGVTLPFVSYGGSSLVTSFLGLGFLLVISGNQHDPGSFGPPLRTVQAGLLGGSLVLAVILCWWAVLRAPVLDSRTDNPRRWVEERFVARGAILDRTGKPLALTVGERGAYQRQYPLPQAAPVVGYDSPRYGQAGIEASYDPILRGSQGGDSLDILWNELLTGWSPAGESIRLTLDSRLQALAAASLNSNAGAAVVIIAGTGEVLAMASAPGYDPNQLESQWKTLTSRRDAPLLNRAAQASYQPGLVIAPLLLAWGADQGRLSLQAASATAFSETSIGDLQLACGDASASASGNTLLAAAAAGCPGAMVLAASTLNGTDIVQAYRAFGLEQGVSLGIASAPPSEAKIGSTPDQILWAALGQGQLTVTPLQIARAFASLVNGGRWVDLRLLDAMQIEGNWKSQTGVAGEGRPISAGTASAFEPFLVRDAVEGHGMIAAAYSGPKEEQLGWFIGAIRSSGAVLLTVVVLEGESPLAARLAGQQLLDAVSASP
jgi:cell division protein FtsW (lipid II flippase)